MPARFDRSVRTRSAQPPQHKTGQAGIPARHGSNGTPAPRTDLPAARPDRNAAPAGAAAERVERRRRQIDASLTRLTAAHAGMAGLVSIAPPPTEPDGDKQGSDRPDAVDNATDDAGTEPPPRSALNRFGRASLVALALVALLLAAYGWGTKAWLNASIHPVAALDPESESIVNPAGQVGDENFLLAGSDPSANGAENQATGGAQGQGNGGAKSDAVMVVHVPADRTRALLVSFPPDLQVTRPPCQRWDAASAKYSDELAPAESQTRLGLAYAVGGPRCLTRVLQQITGLSITRFVGLDLAGVREMVDALQGVEICSNRPIVDTLFGPIVPTAGSTAFTGDRALAFARAENVYGDASAEYGRIGRQQQLMSAVIRKSLSNQVLLDPARLQTFLAAFVAHTVTDGAGADELVTLARSLNAVDGADVTVRIVPTTGTPNALGNEVLRESDTKALFEAVRDGKPFPPPPTQEAEPSAAAQGAQQAAQRSAVPDGSRLDGGLQVLNASDRRGLADEVRNTLTQLGFTVDGIGNAEPTQRTTIRFTPDHVEQADRLATVVPVAVLTPDATVPGGLQLVLGKGYDRVIRPPGTTGIPAGGTASCG